jgi:c-di-GMP-binding flagellar brake protein YcgR
MSPSKSESQRRRYSRVALKLPGRYMLSDGQELDCQIIDVSPAGVAIRGPLPGIVGEHIVAYFQELGRIEGVVVRSDNDWFAIELQVPSNRLQRLAIRIDGLTRRRVEGAPERRGYAREDLDQEPTTLLLADGGAFAATIIDISTGGVALEVDVAPPIGEAVTIGERRAKVSRHFAGGIAVTFDVDSDGDASEPTEAI